MVNWDKFVARDSVRNWPENSRKVDGKSQPYGSSLVMSEGQNKVDR